MLYFHPVDNSVSLSQCNVHDITSNTVYYHVINACCSSQVSM